ncbi:response regulator transcription factor [Desulfallas thermosapovorans]|uniref:Stage 0 sporulation protein A homolog n=1 Tax=Desulfallas thermosapovorans DSM 6562 TaxID=1121431 RepID=A0A5S4ZTY3_9FIRM|nr:response regulator transcription factor [Desulfallas thermosapovorans]TYO96160.1 two component transcriptional regulator, winged helix family [Desulfallas thermosapovorans DSM 6562]
MKILVIDDDKKITSMMQRVLTFEGHETFIAYNGEEGLHKAEQYKPDLVILDIMMPRLDGWEVCRKLRMQSDVPILMLTARDEVADRVRGLDVGADDYLVKPFALEELLARVRALFRRVRRLGHGNELVLSFADLTLDLEKREARRGDTVISLTTREFELLKLFMQHPRQVLTRDQIMEQIWGYDFSGESNVLEVYIGNLRQKLEQPQAPKLLHTVRGVGYTLREQ